MIAPGNVEVLSEAGEMVYGDGGNRGELGWMSELDRTWRHVIRDNILD